MKWENNRQSDNVEDLRGQPGGGGGGRRVGGRGVGLGTIAVALIAGWIFGINPMTILGVIGDTGTLEPAQTQSAPAQKPGDEMGRFVASVLGGTEDVWSSVFQQGGATYEQPRLVLFRGSTPTACGSGQAAMGPFYCPGDKKVYIDLSFYETMKRELGAPGDFAQAYVIAHEVGHHVQNLLGISDKVDAARSRLSERDFNVMSVRLELQADCFAGIWAHHNQKTSAILEPGDVDEALNAAAAIGDDALQRKSQGQVVPDSFTHGSSEQRQRWFHRGLDSGAMKDCDTFNTRKL